VESIQHVHRLAAARLDNVQERLPHVTGDKSDLARSLWSQQVEEGVEALDLPITGNVQQASAAVVNLIDDGQVFVSLFPGELIDAD
jgi:hypothetical protein